MRTVSQSRIGFAHLAAVSSLAGLGPGGILSAVAHEYTSRTGFCFIHRFANFFTTGTRESHIFVLKGLSRARTIVRTPAAANASRAALSKSGAMAYVFWRGE